ncbi:amino acid/amide ABC transporter substrate-binding protein, HAAT family [Tistlia consotensis]|uniref:Amino acid/amide ABC transporter substrate-binding protein, HAAT family n=1 Tax=Tistlia consotensis USBA 355 TaxID=560819 RepID=A0A1Y6CAX1_9PROT|nr:ABC transporter substrate-binding protein [Tistlia consotensis]SMF45671.1 amino acid/amide ABC transporter substrate-binding protein, HAAT family [Tistlia consotensis USBA 355]SNR79506.1 amino acid/amide ABC transporter substrate-binding protein, HAAT family [Tistlia consotensis]
MTRTALHRLPLALAAGLLVSTAGFASTASAADTIKIGAPFNVTGALSSLDAPALNGAKLKVKEINDAGGVLGKQLELEIYDTKTDPTVIASVASQLVSQDVPVGMGFTDSDSVLALGPIFQQAGIPFVTPGATSPKLPDQIGDMIFLACFGDNVQAAAGDEYLMNEAKAKKVFLLRDNSTEYTTLLAKYFDEAFTHDGGRVIARDDYKSGDKTFTAQITKLKALSEKPDALYVSAMPDDIGLIVKQMRQAGVTEPIVGGDGYDTPLLIQVGGKAADGVVYSTHAFMATDSTPAIQKFYKDYKAAYGMEPENAFAALGYDTVGLIADAIKRAGAADPKKIRDALAATQGYKGITGSISYPEGTRVPAKTVAMIGVKNDKLYLADEVTPKWIAKP